MPKKAAYEANVSDIQGVAGEVRQAAYKWKEMKGFYVCHPHRKQKCICGRKMELVERKELNVKGGG